MERKLSKIYTSYAILFFTFIIPLINALSAEETEIKAPSYQVKVVDGDSLEINSIRIRLMGIDAPEYTQTCKTDTNKKYYCGQDSINHLNYYFGGDYYTGPKTIVDAITSGKKIAYDIIQNTSTRYVIRNINY